MVQRCRRWHTMIDLGRHDGHGDSVTSLVLHTTDAPPPKAKAKGGNQYKAEIALKEWLRTNPGANHISSDDLKGLLKAGSPSIGRWYEQTRPKRPKRPNGHFRTWQQVSETSGVSKDTGHSDIARTWPIT